MWILDVLLVRALVVGRLVLFQRVGATAVEEVDRRALLAAAVGCLLGAIEVAGQVKVFAIKLSWGQDAGHDDANVWLGVCKGRLLVASSEDAVVMTRVQGEEKGRELTVANDNSVDEGRQQGVLLVGRVFLEEGSRVVVADGCAVWPLSNDKADGRNGQRCCDEAHGY